MKKIIFVLSVLFLASCSKEAENDSIIGTVWRGESESYSSYGYENTDGTTYLWENTTKMDITIHFDKQSTGRMVIVYTNSNDEVKDTTDKYDFTYTYDINYMRGKINYENIVGDGLRPPTSEFSIRDGFLIDNSDITGEVEYYRVK
ncbi:MAG TPA: hypothetical protein DDW85_05980 [Porphyromonadaceae bacterium]|nr:hypothetical protein [Porphyromonadaceae bacterium]